MHQPTMNETVDDQLTTTSDELTKRLEEIHGYAAKAGQLEAIQCFSEGHDVLLLAKTGYGKSMILYSQSALKTNTITLLIMPLNALEVDQANAIKKNKCRGQPVHSQCGNHG